MRRGKFLEMRSRLAQGALLLAVACALLVTTGLCVRAAASGGETVSMHFDCKVVDARVQLETAPLRTYPIIGERKEQTLRVCSGSRGTRCRSLVIQKFKFDCGGAPVEWIDAAAAAVRGQPWRATLSDARMTLHYWPDGPTMDRRLPLTLPPKFAPPPASGLRFEKSEPPAPVELPATAPSAATSVAKTRGGATPGPAEKQPDPPAAPLPTQVVALNGADAASSPMFASDVPAVPTPSELSWTASAAAVLHDEMTRKSWWRHLVPTGLPNALFAGIGVAALLLSATAMAARQQSSQRISGSPSGASPFEALSGEGAFSPPSESASSRPTSSRPDEQSPPVDETAGRVAELASALLATSRTTPPPVSGWASIVEMRQTADALLELVRQIIVDHVPAGALRDVLVADLAVIAARLEAPELAAALADGRLDLVHPVYAQAILDLERARTLARIEHERALEAVGEAHRSPSTVEEACTFLGINPRASETVVKKVVDALRQNWHPDLAGDEMDRVVREERIKRINAAWDLIRAR
ncbi:MAG: hypothetical protein R3D44_03355 [Hyphomicrobiaceae bacterium]